MIRINPPDPIFIHGILPRCGTNFLWDLLLLHRDCGPAVHPVREDLFLDHSDPLTAFAAAVQAAWDPRWGEFDTDIPARLQAAIGTGLLSFLWTDRSRRLIVKNPSVKNLGRFFGYFPTAYLIVLVRDGRSVTQSCMDTFGWTFERAARAWAAAANEIQHFREVNADRADRWRLVRYEDLLDDLEPQIMSLLQFAGLDIGRYDLNAARNLPIRGSSAFFGPGRSSVNWDPVEKDHGFAPKERWRAWPSGRLARFEWIAGDQLRTFGYETQPQSDRALHTTMLHTLADLRWTFHQAAQSVRRQVGSTSRPLRRRMRLVP
jgi:protein-tyrosine sulfotransferase